jgi:2-dehydropantoate 2-reductase
LRGTPSAYPQARRNPAQVKTSMLQDVEAGRDPEIDALVGAVIELGQLTQTSTPHNSAIYTLMQLLSKTIAEGQICVRATPRMMRAA